MKFLVRWAFRLLILVIVLVIGLILVKDSIMRSLAEARLRQDLGMEVRIGKMEVALFSPSITLENVRVFNPPEFGGSPFLILPELHLEYDRAALGQGRVRLDLLRLDLAELNLVRNAAGKTNLASFATTLPGLGTLSLLSGKQQAASARFGGIQTLNLSIGRLTFTDLRPPALTREVRVDLRNEVATNLQTELDVIGVVARSLVRRGITIMEFPSREGGSPPAAIPRTGRP